MKDNPYLRGQPVSEPVRLVQVESLLVKGPSRAPAPPPPEPQYPRKTLLERKARKA
jgi:hypothetical protein